MHMPTFPRLLGPISYMLLAPTTMALKLHLGDCLAPPILQFKMQPVGLLFLFISLQPMFSFGTQFNPGWRLNSSLEAAPIARTIFVDIAGEGDFTSIQEAVDSIPNNNSEWIRIHVLQGIYREKVLIPVHKQFIFLEGEGPQQTIISWGDAKTTRQSPTFEVRADNFAAKDIAFKNTYNLTKSTSGIKPAVAAKVSGDKHSFYSCAFLGVQDTLWDDDGRHFFSQCYIEGAIDFIFGAAQSIYLKCQLKVIFRPISPAGYITAQGRERAIDANGFVFQLCSVFGDGRAYLGRAWKAASRVVFYKTDLASDVVAEGWDAWDYVGHEENIVYAEVGCTGKGSDMSGRVEWEKKLRGRELNRLISMSFINSDGWIERQPYQGP